MDVQNNGFYSQFSINSNLDLNVASNRIEYENQLINGSPSNAQDFQFCTQVILLLCEKMASDSYESWDERKMEDALINKMIYKFSSSPILQKSANKVQNSVEEVFAEPVGKINSWEIFQNITGHLSPSLLSSTKASLLNELKKNGEIDRQDLSGNTALMMAVKNADVQLVKNLITNHANCHLMNADGESAFMLAIKGGNNEIKKALGEALLWNTVKSGDLSQFNWVISLGVDLNIKINGGTPLMYAVNLGQTEVVKALLNANVDPSKKVKINECDRSGLTALILAARRGNVECVKILIENKADLEVRDTKCLYSPLMHAISKGDHEIVKVLVKAGADIDIVGVQDLKPLELAILSGSVEVVRELIGAGINLNQFCSNRITPLIKAIDLKNSEMVNVLLEAKNRDGSRKVNIDQIQQNKNTALITASLYGNVEIVKILIDNQADLEKKDEHLRSALHSAVGLGHSEVAKLLMSAGAEVNSEDDNSNTPLLTAMQCDKFECFELLIEAGADIHHLNKDFNSVYSVMVFNKNPEKYKKILSSCPGYTEIKSIGKQKKMIRSIGHVLDLDGTSTLLVIRNKELRPLSIKLEGGGSKEWFVLMQKDFVKFKAYYPTLLTPEKSGLFEGMIQAAVDQDPLKNFERIQQGLPTILTSGYKGHHVSLFVWGNEIAINNGGAGNTGVPIEFYQYTPESLSIELVTEIENANRTEEEFFALIEKLHGTLNFAADAMENQLREATQKRIPMQTVGNCSWKNSVSAIYAFMQIGAARFERNGKLSETALISALLEASIEEQTSLYQKWLGSQQLSIMERLSQQLGGGSSSFKLDLDLFEKSFSKAETLVLDPINKNRLNTISQIYDAFLNASGGGADVEFEMEEEMGMHEAPIQKQAIKRKVDQIETTLLDQRPTKKARPLEPIKKRKADAIEATLLQERPAKIVKPNLSQIP